MAGLRMIIGRLMNKKYTTPCPPMGCGLVERHREMAEQTVERQ